MRGVRRGGREAYAVLRLKLRIGMREGCLFTSVVAGACFSLEAASRFGFLQCELAKM